MSPASGRLPLLVVTYPLPGDWAAECEGRVRIKVLRRRGALSEERLIRALRAASGAVTLLTDPVTERVIGSCPGLKVIANSAVGTDNIDLAEAARRGVVVTNTPDVLTEATADLAWTLILGTARRVAEGDRLMRRGAYRGWKPDFMLGTGLGGKVLGIVGMGRIGRAVARRAPAFGMRVRYTDGERLHESAESALGARRVPLDELLATSDVVTLHCPLTAENHHLMSRERLCAMKRGALLINTARGPLVDEGALVECLRSGHLGGAGLDVYEREPLLADGLAHCPNTLLLPHVGSATRETRAAMALAAVRDALAVLDGREPEHSVTPRAR